MEEKKTQVKWYPSVVKEEEPTGHIHHTDHLPTTANCEESILDRKFKQVRSNTTQQLPRSDLTIRSSSNYDETLKMMENLYFQKVISAVQEDVCIHLNNNELLLMKRMMDAQTEILMKTLTDQGEELHELLQRIDLHAGAQKKGNKRAVHVPAHIKPYKFKVKYKPGPQNAADCLSRLSQVQDKTTDRNIAE
ncbi:unnamed protein product [Mytilus edulis]|uniref:Uncharacterized protein n=1 Tax=Mytilus edulis TaxID=6550 RepID=A0A8S3UUS5_MYTED|nr:unnamed protein product [Mytilus edulis]